MVSILVVSGLGLKVKVVSKTEWEDEVSILVVSGLGLKELARPNHCFHLHVSMLVVSGLCLKDLLSRTLTPLIRRFNPCCQWIRSKSPQRVRDDRREKKVSILVVSGLGLKDLQGLSSRWR